MEDKKVNMGLAVTVLVTVLGWGVTFGVCQNKIETNTREINRLEQTVRSDRSDIANINSQLAGLNAKMDLLLDGRILSMKEK
ncbi:MAG: hypothetical protein K6D95_04595 [Treponema sp.]|nr:hypothetical protein [Treponema sp.]